MSTHIRTLGSVRVIIMAVAVVTIPSVTLVAMLQQPAGSGPGQTNRKEGPCFHLGNANGLALGHDRICEGKGLGSSAGVARGDFDHDGFADLAVGVPGEAVGNLARAGAVVVIYGSGPNGLNASSSATRPAQIWTQNTPGIIETSEAGDEFGAALASGDFNGDGYSDLAIGVPGEVLNGIKTGAVNIIYGSINGLEPFNDQLLDPATFRPAYELPFTVKCGEGLAWGDFDGDGYGDLVIKMANQAQRNSPNLIERMIFRQDVGVVYGSTTGISTLRFEERAFSFHIGTTPAVNELAIAAGTISADSRTELVVGDQLFVVPAADGSGRSAGFGQVQVFFPAPGVGVFGGNVQTLVQDALGFPQLPEDSAFGSSVSIGDFNGDVRHDLAIGVPARDHDKGAVDVVYGDGNVISLSAGPGPQQFRQGFQGIAGSPESGDAFGASLASGDFNGDGRGDLAVGIPGESVGSVDDAGAVAVIYGTPVGLSASAGPGNQLWHQNSSGLNSSAEDGDRFGSALAAWNFGRGSQTDLAIAVPFEDVGTVHDGGAVAVLYGTSNGLSGSNSQIWTEGSGGVPGGVEPDDKFGGAIY